MTAQPDSPLAEVVRSLFQLRSTERLWHIPVLASLCSGLPLLLGYYIDHLDYGILACLGGLVILYMPTANLEQRMLTLLLSAFGFIFSFTIGICFSFNPYVSAVVLGLYAMGVNWVTGYFSMGPPGNFFFIMIASMASCMPFDIATIPLKIGLIAFGTVFACIFALIYGLLMMKRQVGILARPRARKKHFFQLTESLTIGGFVSLSLLIAHWFQLDNPYWIPISCLAIMQGVSVTHVWQRSLHRITGTLLGMGLTWLLLQFEMTPLVICLFILVLQFIIEMLVVRHYALAVLFITPMTVFLAEIGRASVDPNQLIAARVSDIVIGSLIGVIGGWVLHNQHLHKKAHRPMRQARIAMLRKRSGGG